MGVTDKRKHLRPRGSAIAPQFDYVWTDDPLVGELKREADRARAARQRQHGVAPTVREKPARKDAEQ